MVQLDVGVLGGAGSLRARSHFERSPRGLVRLFAGQFRASVGLFGRGRLQGARARVWREQVGGRGGGRRGAARGGGEEVALVEMWRGGGGGGRVYST